MKDVIVELHDVFCVHRTGQGDAAALQGAELRASSGEVLGVLGPSGAGKSTLLRVIAGLQTPSAGTVRVMGRDIGRQGERARAAFRYRHLGLLGQSSEGMLSPDLPLCRAVELPLTLRGRLGRRGRAARATELLETVGLRDRSRALPHELSGGERQRVALCAAVAHRPSLLLADEPTGELDQLNAEMILQLIGRLATIDSMTVIIATHDQATASCAARTVTISGGRLAEETKDGERRVVVGESGWMRLPAALREHAGIGDRARAESAGGGVPVRSAGDAAPRPAGAPVMLGVSHRSAPARVQLRAVGFGYGRERRVFDALSHDFERGRMTVINGRSGSGKSTLLRLIAGLDQPDAGELTIDGRSLAELDREQLAALRRERMATCHRSLSQSPCSAHSRTSSWRCRSAVWASTTPRGGRPGCWHHWRFRSERGSSSRDCRQVRHSGLRWRGRWPAAAGCSCSMSRPLDWMRQMPAWSPRCWRRARQEGQTIICASHDPLLISEADDVLALD